MSIHNLTEQLKKAKILERGVTVPTDAAAGYPRGMLFVQTDGTAGTTLYINEGSEASCDFNPYAEGGSAYLSGITPGAVTASKAVVVDASKDIGGFRNVDIGATALAGSLDVFSGSGNAADKITLTATTNGANRGLSITNAALGQATALVIPDPGAADSRVVLTSSANKVIITTVADRTMSLGGNVTLAGALSAEGAVSFTGAFAAVFVVPDASTWTLPAGGGTLATTTGAETGTTSNTFTVDNDCVTGQLKFQVTTGGTNNTVTVTNTQTTGDITITYPNVAGVLASLAGTQTFSGNKTFTGTLDIRGNVSSGGSNPNIDFSGSTGTTKTTTGVVTIGNGVGAWTVTDGAWAVSAGNPAFDASASSGAFTTSSGAVTLSGHTVTAAGKNLTIGTTGTFTTGTGAVTIKGATTFDAGLDITFAGAGDGTFDLSTQTGIFKTSTGTNTLGGDVVISGSKTLTTGTGAATLKGSATFDTTKTLTFGSAAAGTATPLTMYSLTASKGAFIVAVQDNTTDHTVTLRNGTANGANAVLTTPAVTCTLMGTAGTYAATGTYDLSGATVTYRTITGSDLAAGTVTPTKFGVTGLTSGSFTGRNGAGACTLTGAVVGQRVMAICRFDDSATVVGTEDGFEATVTVNDQIQQSSASDFSTQKFVIILLPAAA